MRVTHGRPRDRRGHGVRTRTDRVGEPDTAEVADELGGPTVGGTPPRPGPRVVATRLMPTAKNGDAATILSRRWMVVVSTTRPSPVHGR